MFYFHEVFKTKQAYSVSLYMYIFRAAISIKSQSPFLGKEYCSVYHITIFLIIPFKRILCTNMKNCNFDITRFKIVHGMHMIDFLSHKLSSIIIFYLMNTTLMPKLNQCSLIGKEKNGKSIKYGLCSINIPVQCIAYSLV